MGKQDSPIVTARAEWKWQSTSSRCKERLSGSPNWPFLPMPCFEMYSVSQAVTASCQSPEIWPRGSTISDRAVDLLTKFRSLCIIIHCIRTTTVKSIPSQVRKVIRLVDYRRWLPISICSRARSPNKKQFRTQHHLIVELHKDWDTQSLQKCGLGRQKLHNTRKKPMNSPPKVQWELQAELFGCNKNELRQLQRIMQANSMQSFFSHPFTPNEEFLLWHRPDNRYVISNGDWKEAKVHEYRLTRQTVAHHQHRFVPSHCGMVSS